MFTYKNQIFPLLLLVILLLHAPSLAQLTPTLSEDNERDTALEDVEDKNPWERLGWTSSTTSGSSNVVVSGAGIVWLLLWGVVSFIIASAVLCYWVGCEYASSGGRFNDLVGLYVPESTFSSASLTRPIAPS